MTLDETAFAEAYLEAAGAERDGRYEINTGELSWLLESTLRWSRLRLRFLVALQRALDLPDEGDASRGTPAGDLKGMLTNLIIMQTRLNEREEGFVELLSRADRDALVNPVIVDAQDVRTIALGVLEAYRRLR